MITFWWSPIVVWVSCESFLQTGAPIMREGFVTNTGFLR